MPDVQSSPLIECFTLGPFATNCYVVRAPETDECWIVDAGFAPGPLIESIRRHELNPSRLFLTHAHADHITGLNEVRAAFPGLPVLIHENEKNWLADPALNLSASFGSPYTTAAPDELLTGGESFDLGGAHFDVLFTPGHSPGGITLYCRDSNLALVGDTLFAESIGRYDFPTSNGHDLFRSIRETLYTLPAQTRIHPGHGPPTTIAHEREHNPFVRAQ
jgi:glyoxylase-like metal-dependent hydrolase (beta-lactamase superfamily II)